MKFKLHIILAALCCLVLAGPALVTDSHAAARKQNPGRKKPPAYKVEKSGGKGRNVRMRFSGSSPTEGVVGVIESIRGNIITMDDERFNIAGVPIFDENKRELTRDDLVSGMRVSVLLKYGSVDMVVVRDKVVKMAPITDQKVLDYIRSQGGGQGRPGTEGGR